MDRFGISLTADPFLGGGLTERAFIRDPLIRKRQTLFRELACVEMRIWLQ